jgi:hypothetical protein
MSNVHATVGAYAVNALSLVERAEFEAHLAACPSCQVEAAEFAETLAGLAPLVATPPPAALRASVLSAIAGVRQLPRERVARSENHDSLVADAGPEALRRSRVASVTELRPLGPDEVAPLEEHPSVVPESPWLGITAALSDDLTARRRSRRDRLLAAVVAAAVVLAVVFSGWLYLSWQQNQTRSADAQRENALLTAPDAEVYVSDVNGTSVSFVVSKQRNEALFIGNALAEPSAGSVYQLWTVDGGAARSASLIFEGGSVRRLVRGSVATADGLALTVEPAPNGSLTPTGPVLADVDLPSR